MRNHWPLLVGLLFLLGCDPKGETSIAPIEVSHPTPRYHGGVFRVEEFAVTESGLTFVAKAPAKDPRCAFDVRIQTPPKEQSSRYSLFTQGQIVARPDSNCTAFLTGLAPVMGYAGTVPNTMHVEPLTVGFSILGTQERRTPESLDVPGSFSPDPSGTWIATKLFLAEGKGEAYLNFSPDLGVGELSQKDAEYAEVVMSELSKVMPH